jgi:hypothetical protein
VPVADAVNCLGSPKVAARECSIVGLAGSSRNGFLLVAEAIFKEQHRQECLCHNFARGTGILACVAFSAIISVSFGTGLTWKYEYRPDTDRGRRDCVDPRSASFTGREAADSHRPPAGRHRHSRKEFGVLLPVGDLPAVERSSVVHHVAYWPAIE